MRRYKWIENAITNDERRSPREDAPITLVRVPAQVPMAWFCPIFGHVDPDIGAARDRPIGPGVVNQ